MVSTGFVDPFGSIALYSKNNGPSDEKMYSILEKANRNISSGTDDLIRSLGRIDGIMQYNRYSLVELRSFLKDRSPLVSNKRRKSEVIQLLIEADESRQFTRFMDLPAELRNMVYESAVGLFPQFWARFPESRARYALSISPRYQAQPAVTRLSRATRPEALRPFLRTQTFSFKKDDPSAIPSPLTAIGPFDRGFVGRDRKRSATDLFLSTIKPEYVNSMRHLRFLYGGSPYSGNFIPITATVSIASRELVKFEIDYRKLALRRNTRDKLERLSTELESQVKNLAAKAGQMTGPFLADWFERVVRENLEIIFRVFMDLRVNFV